MHRLGGLEKDYKTSAISTDPINHEKMVRARQQKIDSIATDIPLLKVSAILLPIYWLSVGAEPTDICILLWKL